jgi:uncharacterized membrane protein YfcA
LIIAALLMAAFQFDLKPKGADSLGLEWPQLIPASLIIGMLGALMTIGVGLYAPCMILVSLLGMDPLAPTAQDLIGDFTQSTFSLGRIAVQGQGTHVGMKLTNDDDAYARIGNIIFHYKEATAD